MDNIEAEAGGDEDIAWADADTDNGGAVSANGPARIDQAKSGSLMAALGISGGQAQKQVCTLQYVLYNM